jgi:hypothetical protein
LSPEEQEIRRKEDAIFDELSKKPTFAIGIERETEDVTETAVAKKARKKEEAATKKAAKSSSLVKVPLPLVES